MQWTCEHWFLRICTVIIPGFKDKKTAVVREGEVAPLPGL